MTIIKYTDGHGTEHDLEIDPDISEAYIIPLLGTILDFSKVSVEGVTVDKASLLKAIDVEKFSSLRTMSDAAKIICQIIPDMPENIAYWRSADDFKFPKIDLALEVIVFMLQSIQGLNGLIGKMPGDLISKLTPEQQRQQELDEQIKALLAERVKMSTVAE